MREGSRALTPPFFLKNQVEFFTTRANGSRATHETIVPCPNQEQNKIPKIPYMPEKKTEL
jgi:hypothetical protein